jgi:hypothetical protein
MPPVPNCTVKIFQKTTTAGTRNQLTSTNAAVAQETTTRAWLNKQTDIRRVPTIKVEGVPQTQNWWMGFLPKGEVLPDWAVNGLPAELTYDMAGSNPNPLVIKGRFYWRPTNLVEAKGLTGTQIMFNGLSDR